ncbi:flavodoxin domain-containing protein [Planococcus sp. APC 4015]|nr:flavodoxin domain-containing protein [Planococcus sp. APC 4015]
MIYESMFGNTRRIAEAVARALESDGLWVDLVRAGDAPNDLAMFALVIVGSPTHAHTLPLPASRTQAAAWADDQSKALVLEAGADGEGVREWLERCEIPHPTPHFAAFSTRSDIPRLFAGDAAVGIRRRLRKRGVEVTALADFEVDVASRLVHGEEARAATWALTLARSATSGRSVTPVVP